MEICGYDSLHKVYLIFCPRGKGVAFREIVQVHLPSRRRTTVKGKNLFPWEEILSSKSSSQFSSDIIRTVKVKCKINFGSIKGYVICKVVREYSGKSQGIFKWKMNGNPE